MFTMRWKIKLYIHKGSEPNEDFKWGGGRGWHRKLCGVQRRSRRFGELKKKNLASTGIRTLDSSTRSIVK